jgi:hypothetical protein
MAEERSSSRRGLLFGAAQLAAALGLPRPGAAAGTLPKMIVTRDPNCGCCGNWIEHVRAAGFPVEVAEVPDVQPLKTRLGVPDALSSCHTAEVGGYVLEGHVPAVCSPSGRRRPASPSPACRSARPEWR